MTKKTRYFMTGSAAVLAGGLCTGLVAYYGGGFQALVASTGSDRACPTFRPTPSVVAYADVKSIMDSELRQRFKQSVPMPMGEEGQREFFEKTGIDIENDIDYVVAAATALPGGGSSHPNGVVVARGRFDIVKLEGLAREHGAQVQEYKGKRLLTLQPQLIERRRAGRWNRTTTQTHDKTGVLAFLEPGLVAIGDLASVQRAIDAQLSAHSITSNNEMMDLVTDIEQTNNAWAVGRFDLIASQAKLPDEIAQQDSPGQVARGRRPRQRRRLRAAPRRSQRRPGRREPARRPQRRHFPRQAAGPERSEADLAHQLAAAIGQRQDGQALVLGAGRDLRADAAEGAAGGALSSALGGSATRRIRTAG